MSRRTARLRALIERMRPRRSRPTDRASAPTAARSGGGDAADGALAEPASEPPEVEAGSDLPPLFDADEAARRAGGRPDLARDLFAMLCRNLAASHAELARARANAHPEAIRAAAHRLRGAAAYCGVPRLHHTCAEVERATRDLPAGELETALDRLEATIVETAALGPDTPEGAAPSD